MQYPRPVTAITYFTLDWSENEPLPMLYEPLCWGSCVSLSTPNSFKCRKSAQDTTAVQKHTILESEKQFSSKSIANMRKEKGGGRTP